MTRVLLSIATAALVLTSTVAAQGAFPSKIELPDGFQPEGIAIAGERFFVGSIPTGRIYSGSLRTGEGDLLVSQTGRAAIGLKVDRGRLFVAGGPTGSAFVYNSRSGALIRTYQLSTGGSFINDVVVTKRAAWFTDSQKPVLYRVPLGPSGRPGASFTTVSLEGKGDYQHVAGEFNLNGIDDTANGKTLVVVQSFGGRLFTVTPAGATRAIALAGGESVPNGDGILLEGRTLYVVQNRSNVVAKIGLSPNLRSGRILTRIENDDFDVPTTIARHGSRLYAVNARFGTATTPDYWVTQFSK